MIAHLAAHPARFDFLVQPQGDPAAMPVDDPTIPWDETASPPIKVATLVIPPQTFAARSQLEFAETLSFTPWHTLPVHSPLGAINLSPPPPLRGPLRPPPRTEPPPPPRALHTRRVPGTLNRRDPGPSAPTLGAGDDPQGDVLVVGGRVPAGVAGVLRHRPPYWTLRGDHAEVLGSWRRAPVRGSPAGRPIRAGGRPRAGRGRPRSDGRVPSRGGRPRRPCRARRGPGSRARMAGRGDDLQGVAVRGPCGGSRTPPGRP